MTRIAALLTVACCLALATVAFAEADRQVAFDETTTKLEWSGTGSGAGLPGPVAFQPTACDEPGHDCDYTLVHAKVPGTLLVTLTPEAGVDVDLFVIRSDSKGSDNDDQLASSTSILDAPEEVSVKLKPGFFLIRADFYTAASGSFDAVATFKPEVAEVPAPGPGVPGPAVNAPPQSKVVKASKTGFSGTASDDAGVAKVEVGVLMKAGSKCKQLTRSGAFKPVAKCGQPTVFLPAKGTTKWSLKLRKALKKGSYAVFSRATDSAGAVQSGFKSKSLKVKR